MEFQEQPPVTTKTEPSALFNELFESGDNNNAGGDRSNKAQSKDTETVTDSKKGAKDKDTQSLSNSSEKSKENGSRSEALLKASSSKSNEASSESLAPKTTPPPEKTADKISKVTTLKPAPKKLSEQTKSILKTLDRIYKRIPNR